jgi:ketosteroid isomerase-like protein
MQPEEILGALTSAVEHRNGAAVAALFTEDGVYHDVFYGSFAGRARIAALIEDWFYRDADDFRWDMHAPVSDGRTLYARYVFSYRSTLPGAEPGRVVFEGVAVLRLRDGLIAEYGEVANVGPAFTRLGFAAERIAKLLRRQDQELRGRAEAARHVAD